MCDRSAFSYPLQLGDWTEVRGVVRTKSESTIKRAVIVIFHINFIGCSS